MSAACLLTVDQLSALLSGCAGMSDSHKESLREMVAGAKKITIYVKTLIGE